MTDVTISADDLDVILNEGDQVAGWPRYSEACDRLRAALNAVQGVSTSTETPEQSVTGSGDERTSTGASGTTTGLPASMLQPVGFDDSEPDPLASLPRTVNLLHWLIAASVDTTIGVVAHGDSVALRVALDLDDPEAVFIGDHLSDLLAQARAYCEREGIGP